MQDMQPTEHFDVVVVGAGLGGIYAVHKFSKDGLKVVAFEKADQIGGVWNYNRYPGARVDVDSIEYTYSFSAELYREWRWSERYASQPELLAYLNHVVDRFDLRGLIRTGTPVTGAEWRPGEQRYIVSAGEGQVVSARFLVMATGNLSEPRDATLPGLSDFQGLVVRSSRWPEGGVDLAGKRVGIVGTGSSSVQATPVIAEQAEHLYVFQRTAHYSVPAQNGPFDEDEWKSYWPDPPSVLRSQWKGTKLYGAEGARSAIGAPRPAADYTPEEQQARLETQWAAGGQKLHVVFADQATNKAANDIVAEFVRNKIRQTVKDPVLAEKLCPKYPIGTRRLILDTGYYETWNRDNISLVDIRESPIERITERGVLTTDAHYDLDVLVLALGFKAFVGEIDLAGIRNEKGQTPTSGWSRGPRTLLGLMTAGFPNFFTLTGPGSPSVLANLFPQNEYHVDWVADCIRHLDQNGYTSIEPEEAAQDVWTNRVSEAALRLLRLQGNDYMVHRNADGTRVFIPWAGGVDAYTQAADAAAANGYQGFKLRRGPDAASAPHPRAEASA
jgi:cation diffusion facilitator CzcD-associated flavoprotein CzcO